MRIWVDADACPRPAKDVLYRVAERTGIQVTLVANQYLAVPKSAHISALQVPAGFDVADNEIVRRLAAGDLVITADIPLADEVIAAGATALNPRGTLYTSENIKDHLQRRDMMDQLRSTGVIAGGPDAYGRKETQAFANALDRFVTRHNAQNSG
ncbi:MAG: YaiI/YqxD family protein [Pseudomonadota bacterium]